MRARRRREARVAGLGLFLGRSLRGVADPFGYIWALATVKEVLTPEQVHQRMMQYMAHMQSAGDRTNCG